MAIGEIAIGAVMDEKGAMPLGDLHEGLDLGLE